MPVLEVRRTLSKVQFWEIMRCIGQITISSEFLGHSVDIAGAGGLWGDELLQGHVGTGPAFQAEEIILSFSQQWGFTEGIRSGTCSKGASRGFIRLKFIGWAEV